MKYKKEFLAHAELYCSKLGLDNRLIHIPRTQIQADALYDIQFDCETQHKALYQTEKDKDLHNPDREQYKAIENIQELKSHLSRHHFAEEIEMITQLTALEKRIDINNRWRKPSRTFDTIIANINDQLLEAGFKKTNIEENILPVFKRMIKDE